MVMLSRYRSAALRFAIHLVSRSSYCVRDSQAINQGPIMIYKFKSQAASDVIMLRQRAGPFIELLRCSAEAGKDVVWGV